MCGTGITMEPLTPSYGYYIYQNYPKHNRLEMVLNSTLEKINNKKSPP